MSALVDRITAVLRYHGFDTVYADPDNSRCAYTPDGYVCDWRGSEFEHAAHVAERIAEALPDFKWLMARLDNAEKMVYANIGPSPVLLEIRAAKKLLADQPEEKP